MGTINRWDKKVKERKDVPCPEIILAYNKNMGGVDFADMLIALYQIKVKTRQWYIKIFWHLIDICKANAWNMYRRHRQQNSMSRGRFSHSWNFQKILQMVWCKEGKYSKRERQTFKTSKSEASWGCSKEKIDQSHTLSRCSIWPIWTLARTSGQER